MVRVKLLSCLACAVEGALPRRLTAAPRGIYPTKEDGGGLYLGHVEDQLVPISATAV